MEYMKNLPYANIVGSVMYSMVSTRPDLAYALSVLSRFMSDPGKQHRIALKSLLQYLKGSLNVGLLFKRNEEAELHVHAYVDSNHGGCLDLKRSTSVYTFTVYGGAVSWKSSHQKMVTLSSTEAEYIAPTEAVKEALWIKGFIVELSGKERKGK